MNQDAKILKSFDDAIRGSFATELTQGAVARESASRAPGDPARVRDSDSDTYCSTPNGVTLPTITPDLRPGGGAFDLICLYEYLPLGYRVTRIAADALIGEMWRRLAEKECLGAQRIIRLDAPVVAPNTAAHSGSTGQSCYQRDLDVPLGRARSRAGNRVKRTDRAFDRRLDDRVGERTRRGEAGRQRCRDDLARTRAGAKEAGGRHLNFGDKQAVGGFSLPTFRQVTTSTALPKDLVFETSRDGRTWERAAAGEFPNIAYGVFTQRLNRCCRPDALPKPDVHRDSGARASAGSRWHRRLHAGTVMERLQSIAGCCHNPGCGRSRGGTGDPPADRRESPLGPDIFVTARMRCDARAWRVRSTRSRRRCRSTSRRRASPFRSPGVARPPLAGAQVIVNRIPMVAADTGPGVGTKGCAHSLLVIVTADGRAALWRTASRRSGNVGTQMLADLRGIAGEPGHARAHPRVETDVRSRNGEAAVREPGASPVLNLPIAGRISLGFRRDIVSATALIDTAAVPGRRLIEIAEYAAMHGLADARAGKDTILAAFTPDRDAGGPQQLSAFEHGFLDGLYAGQGNVASAWKRANITARIVREAQPRDQHR